MLPLCLKLLSSSLLTRRGGGGELTIEFLYLLSLELTSDGDLEVYGCLSLMSSVLADDLGEDLQCEGGDNEDMAHDMLAD